MVELKTVTPHPDTPTASITGKKGKIDGVSVWLKGASPTGTNSTRSPYNERAAYLVNLVLGLKLVPPTVLCLVEGEVASAMKWVRGGLPHISRPPLLDLFDYLIDNNDRHYGNWLVNGCGKVWAIDNAFAFHSTNTGTFYADSKVPNKVPNKVKQKLREVLANPKEFHRQLDWLVGKSSVVALINRMKEVLRYKPEKGR